MREAGKVTEAAVTRDSMDVSLLRDGMEITCEYRIKRRCCLFVYQERWKKL